MELTTEELRIIKRGLYKLLWKQEKDDSPERNSTAALIGRLEREIRKRI